ncbi:hypothetical protein FRB99_005324 [Tulasnella sp. 403]|nr:hypothetical protein FRB99_005324 [Tulasnella sp. 403]
MSQEVTINVKGKSSRPNELKLTITIELEKTVKDLKAAIADKSNVEAERQRLIYSGRVLKDDDQLSTYKIQSNHTVHMVKGVARTQPESSTPQRLPSMQTGQNPSDPLTILNTPMAHGALAGFNPFAEMGMNPNDPNMFTSFMDSPQAMEQMSAMMARPEVIEQLISMDPMLRNNPQMQQLFRSEQFRSMISNPEVLRNMMNMTSSMRGGGMGGGFNPFMGGAGAGTGSGSPFGGAAGGFPLFGFPPIPPLPTNTTSPTSGNATSTAEGTTPSTQPAGNTTTTPGSNPPGSPGAAGTGLDTGAGAPGYPFGAVDPTLLLQLLGGMGGPPAGLFGGLGGPSSPPATSGPPPEERYQTQLQQLRDMGFTNARQNVRALIATGGNVEQAVAYILEGGGL